MSKKKSVIYTVKVDGTFSSLNLWGRKYQILYGAYMTGHNVVLFMCTDGEFFENIPWV